MHIDSKEWDDGSSEVRSVDSLSALRMAAETIIKATSQQLFIYSERLEPKVFSDRHLIRHFEKIALSNRRAELRFLCADVRGVVATTHPILELSRKLSSYVQIKDLPEDYNAPDELILLSDEKRYILLENPELFTGTACMNARSTGHELAIRFERMWQESSRPPDTLRLHI